MFQSLESKVVSASSSLKVSNSDNLLINSNNRSNLLSNSNLFNGKLIHQLQHLYKQRHNT